MTDRIICSMGAVFLGGILYGRYRCWYLPVGVLLLVILLAADMAKRYGRKAAVSIAVRTAVSLLLFAVTAGHARVQTERNDQIEQRLSLDAGITVLGEIYQTDQKKEQFIYYLRNTRIFAGQEKYRGGKVQVYSSEDSYQMGNQIQVTGWFEAFQCPRNEGNFNEKQYYHSKNIRFRVISQEEIILSPRVNRYRAAAKYFGKQMEQVIAKALTPKEAGILMRMLLGRKDQTDQEIKTLYQKTGISHVLAISGLHVSILGMGLYRFLRKIKIPGSCSGILALGTVIWFGIMTGLEISTLRAILMFFLMMAGRILGKTYDSLTALFLSGMIQVWENPQVLEYAGFLFSYGAVLGAVLTANILGKQKKQDTKEREVKAGRKKLLENMAGIVKTSLCIQLATLPITLFFYYETPVYGVLANGCVLPFMGILLFSGLAGGLAGMVYAPAAVLLLIPAKWIIRGYENVCRLLLKLPGAVLITGQPEWGKIAVYYLICGIVLYALWRKQQWRYLGAAVAAVLVLCVGNTPGGMELDVLDVGQGDGIYWKNEKGEHFFLDGGSTDVGNVGTYRILPFLKCKGAGKIRAWFVSHADADHINGLQEVLESDYPIEYLVLAQGMVRDEAWEGLVALARKKNCRICYLKAGAYIESGDMRVTALYPEEEGGTDRNGASMVMVFQWREVCGLLTGDIGNVQEQELLEQEGLEPYASQGMDFYKAAHHGSNYSNSSGILEKIKPENIMVSCGKKNRYGHPGKEAVARMEKNGSRMFYTMEKGQIKLRWRDGEVQISQIQN